MPISITFWTHALTHPSDEMWSSIDEFTSETEEKAKEEMKKSAKSSRSVPTEATVNLVSGKKLCSVNEVINCEHFM